MLSEKSDEEITSEIELYSRLTNIFGIYITWKFYSEQPFLLHENIHAFKLTKDLLNLMGSCIGISEYLFTCKSMLTE